ncbi:sporulation protein YqfD [Clostridium sp. CAG:433]|nr:sporulation protein YqfD [Clostridium sp. CAG:433]
MNSYLIIKVEGKIIEKFILRCKKNNINLLKIERISNKEIIIKINSKDYENLNKIKSIYTLTIINNEGYLKFKEELNKNKVFIIMAILGLLFLIYLSNTIFSVNIISMNKDLNEKIIKELDSYGIKKYHLKKSYDSIEKIKKKITDKYKDSIEWIEITDIGTKYEVKIVERKKQSNNVSTEYTNIVAKKSGVIKKIYAEDGLKMVEPNTYVNKGDVIISGAITKDEEVKKYVHAKGKVYAEVWYDVSIEFPLKYTEKKYTNNNKRSFYIKIGKDYISRKKYKNFERKKIFSLKNRLVPFEVGIENQKEIKIINDTYNINEAKTKAKDKVKEKILQSLDKDEYILDEKTLNFYQKDSKIVLDMFITCYEEIGKEEKIEPITEE